MKKKWTMLLAVTCAVGSCLSLAGCKPSKDEAFEEGFKAIYAQNSTIISTSISAYPREEAEIYGDWRSSKIEIKTDDKTNCREIKIYRDYWTEATEEEKATFTIENFTYYYFEYKQNYYCATDYYRHSSEESSWIVEEEEKEDFLDEVKNPYFSDSYLVDKMALFSSMKSLIIWNKDLNRYEITMGMTTTSINILEDKKGVEFCEESLLTKGKISITDIGTTAITIPNEVIVEVDKYIGAI